MIGLWIALPVLTIIGDTLSVIGGGFIGLTYHVTLDSYYHGVGKYLTPANLLVGMIKPVFFAILITTVACWKGLTSEGGAKGVGVATTESVVISSVGILVTDSSARSSYSGSWAGERVIEFRNVDFSIDERRILTDVSFKVRRERRG